jgi:GAF domain
MDDNPNCIPDSEAVRDAVARLCGSSAFSGAPRRISFLRFIVERALNGDAPSLKAYTIGVGALGRPTEFNPASDPIVRVVAGRLRGALAQYYATEGALDPVLITVPRGSYVPVFAQRDTTKSASEGTAKTGTAIHEIMKILAYVGHTLLGADNVALVLRDGEHCHYVDESASAPLWKGERFPMRACIAGWCMTERQAVSINDIYKDSRIPIDTYRSTSVRSLAMVPLPQDQPIGAIGVHWSVMREPSSEEMELLQSVANLIALAMTKVEMGQKNSKE